MSIMNDIAYVHGLYDAVFKRFLWRNMPWFDIPIQFANLLFDKAEKWNSEKYSKYPLIPFTIGWLGDIYAIAIVHPWDLYRFKLQTGENIVRGRIKRQLGLMNRLLYTNIPETDKDGKILYKENGDIIYKEPPPYIIAGNLD